MSGPLPKLRAAWRVELERRDVARKSLDVMLERFKSVDAAEQAAHDAYDEAHKAFEAAAGALATGDGEQAALDAATKTRREAEERALAAEAGTRAVSARVVELRRSYAAAASKANAAGLAYLLEAAELQRQYSCAAFSEAFRSHARYFRLAKSAYALEQKRRRADLIAGGADEHEVEAATQVVGEPIAFTPPRSWLLDPRDEGAGIVGVARAASMDARTYAPRHGEIGALSELELLALPDDAEPDPLASSPADTQPQPVESDEDLDDDGADAPTQ